MFGAVSAVLSDVVKVLFTEIVAAVTLLNVVNEGVINVVAIIAALTTAALILPISFFLIILNHPFGFLFIIAPLLMFIL